MIFRIPGHLVSVEKFLSANIFHGHRIIDPLCDAVDVWTRLSGNVIAGKVGIRTVHNDCFPFPVKQLALRNFRPFRDFKSGLLAADIPRPAVKIQDGAVLCHKMQSVRSKFF